MNIVLDAMGGDNAPQASVEGALRFAKETESNIELVGNEEKIRKIIKDIIGDDSLPSNISIRHTTEEIIMSDIPTKAIKAKKDSSMVVSLKLVKEGKGDVIVSAGNTGALLTGAILILGRIKGVKRPSMLATAPTLNGKFYLTDAGANTNCDETNIMQFAEMASIYLENVIGIKNPKVGLLNIGEEKSKGNIFYKNTNEYMYKNMEKNNINFYGNIEPNRAILGEVDIVVTDGFTGNIMVKSIEGTLKALFAISKDFVSEIGWKKIFLAPIKNDGKKFIEKYNYKKESAGIFLGVTKPLVKTHGNSDASSFYYALKQAESYAKSDAIKIMKGKFSN